MASGLVLITGANGHIGFRALVFALEAGYHVRAAVRSQEKVALIKAAPSIQRINPGPRLSFAIVPDLLADGAYHDALRGVDYAIHLASPITQGVTDPALFQSRFIDPAIKGTMAILLGAQKEKNLKRIVITSSVVAMLPWNDFFEAETDLVVTETSRTPDPTGPYTNEFEGYTASKVYALNATERWVKDNKPHFSVVHVHPSFTLGKDELVTDKEDIVRGTNGQIMGQVLGNKLQYSSPGVTIHLDDTAMAHVKGLDTTKIPDGQSLLTSSQYPGGTVFSDALDIVKRRYPNAVENGVLPANGETPSKRLLVDASETEHLLGYTFKSYENQVTSVVDHYLELSGVKTA